MHMEMSTSIYALKIYINETRRPSLGECPFFWFCFAQRIHSPQSVNQPKLKTVNCRVYKFYLAKICCCALSLSIIQILTAFLIKQNQIVTSLECNFAFYVALILKGVFLNPTYSPGHAKCSSFVVVVNETMKLNTFCNYLGISLKTHCLKIHKHRLTHAHTYPFTHERKKL